MSKRIHIHESEQDDVYVVGISSEEKVWKICWEINQILAIQLRQAEHPDAEEGVTNVVDSSSMLPGMDALQIPPSYYEYQTSNEEKEYFLVGGELTDIPKSVKFFRYFLIIRSVSKEFIDLPEVLRLLNKSDLIQAAADLTHVKDIKLILP